MEESQSFAAVKKYLGQKVELVIDRLLGSKHPTHGFSYESNYGYVPNTKAPDGGEIDGYYLGVNKSVKQQKGDVLLLFTA